MKDSKTEGQPAGVSETTTQAGDIRARWDWVEPSVWTERMLTALERGIKGGKWFSLIDKVYALANLRAAFQKVKSNQGAAGVDHQTVEMFEQHLEENLGELSQALRTEVIDLKPCDESGLTSWAVKRNAHWEYRRFGIGWCKLHCVT